MQGLSPLPNITNDVKEKVQQSLKELEKAYTKLLLLDEKYMSKIDKNDSYRIEKALLIYEASALTPSEWFEQYPPKPVIQNLNIFNIDVERDVIRERIAKRSSKMLEMGLINEVAFLEYKYTRKPHSMSSIGIIEVLEFFDGKIEKEKMIELISIHTAQLAKRQQTFNKTQFDGLVSDKLENLEEIILNSLK
jgi:tRNA dimethylallyltransferase